MFNYVLTERSPVMLVSTITTNQKQIFYSLDQCETNMLMSYITIA